MLYLDDRFPTHPKILKAGELLGAGGASRALHLYLLGLAYARQNLTDGFIPESFVSSCGAISKSGSIAKVLANRTIRLWRKVKGGYVIHDFHAWNPTAQREKEKREQHREKMRRWRAAKANGGVTRDASRDASRDAHVPLLSMIHETTNTKSTSTGAARQLAFARSQNATPDPATFALACVVMAEALDLARTVDHDLTISTAGEHFKTLCATRGLAYDGDLVRRAYGAVMVAHARRRA
jgi:hypothetical protein